MATKIVDPVTKVTLNISSSNLTSNPLALSCTYNLNKAGTRNGLDLFSGISRRSHGSTNAVKVLDETKVDDDKAHVIYIKCLSDVATEYLEIFVKDGDSPDDANNLLGRVYANNAFIIPYAGHLDVFVLTSTTTLEYEIALFSE